MTTRDHDDAGQPDCSDNPIPKQWRIVQLEERIAPKAIDYPCDFWMPHSPPPVN